MTARDASTLAEDDIVGPDMAELLAETARRLSAMGAVDVRTFSTMLTAVPEELRTGLARVLRPPDRINGWRVVRGLLDRFPDAGPTPSHWRDSAIEETRALDIAMAMMSASIGRLFGWAGQQDGRLVHNIVPSRGYEEIQVGANSTAQLLWHTEDAFHPRRAHMLMLACVRNEDGVGSRVASIRRAALTEQERARLTEPVVAIYPDDSYPDAWGNTHRSVMSTVWRSYDGWCLRYDPAYSRFVDPGPSFTETYQALGAALDACADEVPLAPGDILLIDNDIAVHGRAAFRPRYDGTDRWLKRTLIRLDRYRPYAEQRESGYDQAVVEPRMHHAARS